MKITRTLLILLCVVMVQTLALEDQDNTSESPSDPVSKWSLDLDSKSEAENHEVPLLKFQMNSIMTTESLATFTETLPDLDTYSVCLWLKIYYWRDGSSVVSYALDNERDNALLISQNEQSMEVLTHNAYLLFKNRDSVSYLRKWMHICLVVADEIRFYNDGDRILPSEDRTSQYTGNYDNDTRALVGGGVLVLGQDQDKPGGGYAAENSLSGAIANFQFFAKNLTQEEVKTLSTCQGIISTPMLHLKNNSWEFSNVSVSTIVEEAICKENNEGQYFLFMYPASYSENVKYCQSLGGAPPNKAKVKHLLKNLKDYFRYQYNQFSKLHIYVNISSRVGNTRCADMRVYWEPDKYITTTVNDLACSFKLLAFACKIEKAKLLQIHGVPAEMQDKVDQHYQLSVYKGLNQMLGTQKSYFQFHGDQWCLSSMVYQEHTRLLCYQSKIDFPPLGRRKWTNLLNNRTAEIVLSSCQENQFTCDSGDCIDLHLRCDTRIDCNDRSDEKMCSVLPRDFEHLQSIAKIPQVSLYVDASISVVNIPEINLDINYFVTSLWINISWKDERLTFLNLAHFTETHLENNYFQYNMWVPNIVLKPVQSNAVPVVTTGTVKRLCDGKPEILNAMEENVFSYDCAEVWLHRFYHVHWQCEFNLMRFPFETVECQAIILLDNNQLWSNNITVNIPTFSNLPYIVSLATYSSVGSTLTLQLKFVRQSEGYIVTTFIPIIFLVMIGILTFFFESQDFTNRVMITLTTLIVVASLFAQSASSLPNTSYTKCIDIVFLCTISFLSLIFACHVLLSLMLRKIHDTNSKSVKPMYPIGTRNADLNIFLRPNFWVFNLCIAAGVGSCILIMKKCI